MSKTPEQICAELMRLICAVEVYIGREDPSIWKRIAYRVSEDEYVRLEHSMFLLGLERPQAPFIEMKIYGIKIIKETKL